MNLRPAHARWFELLAARDELSLALEALARTGKVELETRSDTRARLSLSDLQAQMEEYNRLARRYRPYWPHTDLITPVKPGLPGVVLEHAIGQLLAWEKEAAALIQRLEAGSAEQGELRLLESLFTQAEDNAIDYALLSNAGPSLTARLFLLPPGSQIERLPGTLLVTQTRTRSNDFLLALGPPADIDSLAASLAAHKGRALELPALLHGNRESALKQVRNRLEELDSEMQSIRNSMDALAESRQLAKVLGDMDRLEWFLTHAGSLPVTENFAWVTGWTSDPDGKRLKTALAEAGVNAVIDFPAASQDAHPPMVLRNPWWAQPFELFARMLGTPADTEVDPSRLLAILVPLLFGYMFGDVGHGMVLCAAGLVLQRRWPVARILIANGLAATLFGFLFGSVFGREDLIPALWLHPMEDPLPVLLVPLAGGIVVLLLGLILNALGAWWRGELRHWARVEAAVVVLYLSIIAGFFLPGSLIISLIALAWYFTGSLMSTGARHWHTLLRAAGSLLESVFQLLVNTISFVRVGAFALAHGGLSLAFISLAEATHSSAAGFLILLAGNLVVIMLEGLVVTVQTTRLILFEFFIRFLKCTGRMFRPLAAPAARPDTRRDT